MLSEAKHLALAKNNRILVALRFLAPLRSAQNGKLSYVLVKTALTAISDSESVSLRFFKKIS